MMVFVVLRPLLVFAPRLKAADRGAIGGGHADPSAAPSVDDDIARGATRTVAPNVLVMVVVVAVVGLLILMPLSRALATRSVA